jgi:micrococcal nuclease
MPNNNSVESRLGDVNFIHPWKPFMYHYKAEVLSIYDADTITVRIDLGFTNTTDKVLRLARINAWELRLEEREDGLKARDWLRSVIPPGTDIMVKTVKDKTGKYGRYLADIYSYDEECDKFVNLNDELVTMGHAIYKEY